MITKNKKKKQKELMDSLNSLYNSSVLDDDTYNWVENNINNL